MESSVNSLETHVSSSEDQDDVDVIVPVHNGARHISECLASVLSQTLRPRRVVVVDDGSIDETATVVGSLQKDHPSLILHRMKRNAGVSAARNAGIMLSDAPFVAFVDADDIWVPDKLALQHQVFKSSQRPIGLVHSSFFLIDETGNLLPHERGLPPLLRGNVFWRLLRERNILSGSASSVLVRRDILDRAGIFDDQLSYGEDWDLWLRLAAISEVDHTPEALVGIRVRASGAQQKRHGSIDSFLQTMKVYSRWESEIGKEGAILKELRNQGFRAALINARSLCDVAAFYRTLKASKENLVRNLYASRFDFWSGVLVTAVEKACVRLARLIVGGTR